MKAIRNCSVFIMTLLLMCIAAIAIQTKASAGSMIGYWENWGTITLPNVSSNYNFILYSFAVGSGTDGANIVMWTPSATNPLSTAPADISATKAQGKKVILSIGGATSPNITLLNTTDVNTFVSSVEGLVDHYGFQGIDLDLENGALSVNGNDSLTNPTTPDIKFMAQALHTLKSHYGSSFIITYVPETAGVDAYAAYAGIWGAYLALCGATRDILTFCDIQCYNSGSMNAANGQIVAAGGPDFPVAMSELLLHGYTVAGGQNFAALSQSQVAFGNLINGPTSPSTALSAWNYLTKGTADGGSYQRLGGPYPGMAGVMAWDINIDAANGNSMSNALASAVKGVSTGGTTGTTGGTIPPVPTGVTATAGNAQVTVSWGASSGATSYKVYRSTTAGAEGTVSIASPATTSYVNTGLTNGTKYYYKVAAVNATGTSAQSGEVSATPTATVSIPPVPTGVTATAGNGSVTVAWSASAGATSYKVYRSTTAGGEGTVVISSPTGTSFANTGLTNGTKYFYKVAAVNSAGTSGQSSEVSATPSAGGGPVCGPAWVSTTVYASPGNVVSVGTTNYVNNFWTQNQNPTTNNGGPGSGQPWTSQGTCH